MLSIFIVLQVILVIAVVALVLLQNSNVDPISTFSNSSYGVANSMNIKPIKNPLTRITWVISIMFFLNTFALSKIMYYEASKLFVDKPSHIDQKKKEVVDVPFNNE